MSSLEELTRQFQNEEKALREGGSPERQKKLGRLTVRERLDLLLDNGEDFLELGLWAGWKMYEEWGSFPAAGVVTGIGRVEGRDCMIIANDATVKAGAFFPQSVKKVIRAQKIAYQLELPTLYLVDSSGVFLPLQSEIFPDEDDFGRIFRNNALFSSAGIPQFAAIMGNCIAGGGYLPVLCDQLLMTKGSGLYLAGPALVKAAIGHEVDTEELGGAEMHAGVSGTVDYLEEDDPACIQRLRSLVGLLPENHLSLANSVSERDPHELYRIVNFEEPVPYDIQEVLECIVDAGSLQEYKKEYGKTLVTAFAKIRGEKVGLVAMSRAPVTTAEGEVEVGGVIYTESADKAARFIMNCNQMRVPLVFLQDVMGFMVGPQAEASGIIRSGAKLVNALSNSVVPKITVLIGNSFGAGNYALCGKAYDPLFVFAWPSARCAVMGAHQAADTLLEIEKRRGKVDDAEKRHAELTERYEKEMDIRFNAARGWVDAIIAPHQTRDMLSHALALSKKKLDEGGSFQTGVIQV